jgi:hypothetical protein
VYSRALTKDQYLSFVGNLTVDLPIQSLVATKRERDRDRERAKGAAVSSKWNELAQQCGTVVCSCEWGRTSGQIV